MTRRYEAIESLCWKNACTGATASVYGAVPYQRDAESEGWAVVPRGYTIRDNVRGTIGIGRQPFATMAEAEQMADELESRAVSVYEIPVSVAVGANGRQVVMVAIRSTRTGANEAALQEAQRRGYKDVSLFLEEPS